MPQHATIRLRGQHRHGERQTEEFRAVFTVRPPELLRLPPPRGGAARRHGLRRQDPGRHRRGEAAQRAGERCVDTVDIIGIVVTAVTVDTL